MILRENDILSVVNKDLSCKKSTQIKIYQVETFEGKRPKIFVQTMLPNEIKKKLIASGYSVEEKETTKQVTAKAKASGEIINVITRNLHTINWIVKRV